MKIFEILLLIILIVCAIAACVSKRLVTAIAIFMAYSLLMSVLWLLLQAPDLAVTEAAVGAGISTVLFFAVLRKVNVIRSGEEEGDEK